MASSAEIEEFLAGPLVAWLKTCVDDIDNKLDSYVNYFDGFPFREVLLKIDHDPVDPVPTLTEFSSNVNLVSARTQIFYTVFNNIQTIYMDELNQLVIRLPNILALAQDPSTKEALDQLKYLLQLLLSCAVQGPTREYFVERITSMPENRQKEIADIIRMFTMDHSLLVINAEQETFSVKDYYEQTKELATERNEFYKHIVEEARRKMGEGQSCVEYENEKERQNHHNMSLDASHMAVEIVDYKSQIRRLKQTIDERNDTIAELNEELEKIKTQNEKLQNEKRKLETENLKLLRAEDEWDALKEKADQAEYLEKEAINLRRSLIDAKSNKNRADQLFADNKTLQRNNASLEAKLKEYEEEIKELLDAGKEMFNSQKNINDLEIELEAARSKIERLEKRVSELQEIAQLATRAKDYEDPEQVDSVYGDSFDYCYSMSIQEELNNNAEAKILQLQLEKCQLQRAIAEMEKTDTKGFFEEGNKILELEKDKKRLSLQCETLQEEVDRLEKANKAVEAVFQNTIEENVTLQTKVESLRHSIDLKEHELVLEKERQAELRKTIDNCEKDRDNVLLLCDAIKKRADRAEKYNTDLMETVEKLRNEVEQGKEFERINEKLKDKIESLEREVGNLQKEVAKTKELLEAKSVDLDQRTEEKANLARQVDALSKDKSDLLEQVERLQHCEVRAQELQSQATVHAETIAALQRDLVAEKVGNDKFRHAVEKLGLTFDLLESDLNVVVERMLESTEVSRAVDPVYRSRDAVVDADKLEEMASSLTEEWRQEVERLQGDIAALQGSNDALKKDNASLEVDVSTLRSQMQSLQVQQTALQLANSQLVAEKDDLSRQNQQQLEQHKTLSLDQDVLKKINAELTTEYEKLLEEKETWKKSNRDLKADVRTWREKLEATENRFETLNKEKDKAKENTKHLSFLRAEHTKLKNDFRNLLSTSERLKAECKCSRDELQTVRSEFADAIRENHEMKNELTNKDAIISAIQSDMTVLQERCEMQQAHLKSLETTRDSVVAEFSDLCKQSLVCMMDAIQRNGETEEEAKQAMDKYHQILRQKDRLEQTLFDQYKKLNNVTPKKKGFSSIVRRVRKAGSGIMNRSRSNRRSEEEEEPTSQSTPAKTRTVQAEPQVAGPSCSPSGSGESNNSSNGNEDSDEDAIRPDPIQRTPNGHRPLDEVALRRSQRQISRRNSVASEELLLRDSPSLGSIGSRRTVYISEDEPVPSPTPLRQQTPQREINPPLLVYNRISTVIGNDTLCTLGNQTSLPEIPRTNVDNRKTVNPKETAVWYEYGCV